VNFSTEVYEHDSHRMTFDMFLLVNESLVL